MLSPSILSDAVYCGRDLGAFGIVRSGLRRSGGSENLRGSRSSCRLIGSGHSLVSLQCDQSAKPFRGTQTGQSSLVE